MEDSHIKTTGSVPKHADKAAGTGVVPMRHRNRLGVTDLQSNPQGAGKPSTESKMGNANRKSW